jgi:hypothetical protein
MTEFTVTGIRYQIIDGVSLEERTAAAERYLAGLVKGQPVILVAEPDNPIDANAIAVYIDYERIGYINREETDELRPLLNEFHQCDGVVERTDGHITLFISVPNVSENTRSQVARPRLLPESPLGDNVRMPFAKPENALQLIASRLAVMETDKDNVHEVIRLAERYVPLLKLSVCHDDTFWLNRIGKKLHGMVSKGKELGLGEEDTAKLADLNNKVRAASGDMHRTIEHWPERIFVNHLDRLRNDGNINSHLYKKYCDTFLDGKTFEQADKAKMSAELERLRDWLKDLKWSEMRDPSNLLSMGNKADYLGLSRKELYDLYSVLLLIEQLEAALKTETKNPIDQSGDNIPEVLATSPLWEKVKQAGLVDDGGQPTVSRPEAALMADALAHRLGISNKWKVFEKMWHRNNMRGDYNTALNQRKSLEFQDELKNILD